MTQGSGEKENVIAIEGLEIQIDPSSDEETVSKLFEVMNVLDESEQTNFILSTAITAF